MSDAPRLSDLPCALGLLTRLPVTGDGMRAMERGARAAWAWPAVGLVTGGLAALVAVPALSLGLGPAVAAGLALSVTVIATGCMHEDGLADTADGLWGGWTRERRLEIMGDSRMGAYGTLALVLSVGLRWAALAALFAQGAVLAPLLAAGVISRVPMVLAMGRMRPARDDGLSAKVGRPGTTTQTGAIAVALIVGLLTVGIATLPALLAAAAVSAGLALIARARIGGHTGDILGACQQLSEIAVLLTLLATL